MIALKCWTITITSGNVIPDIQWMRRIFALSVEMAKHGGLVMFASRFMIKKDNH